MEQIFNECLNCFVDSRTLPIEFPLPPKSNVTLFVDDINGGPHRVASAWKFAARDIRFIFMVSFPHNFSRKNGVGPFRCVFAFLFLCKV